jgi:uncharacterized protein (UPF0210 family)
MPRSAHAHRPCLGLATVLLLMAGSTIHAQAPSALVQNQTAPAVKPKIRAITFFLNLDRAQYQSQIADALKSLRFAQTVFESRGYAVQNLQIATQPFPEYTRDLSAAQALKFLQDLDGLATRDKLHICIGPAMYHARDSTAQAEMLGTVLLNTTFLSGSVVVADNDGLHANAAAAAARIVRKLSENSANGQANLRFAALAMVRPLTPSLPSAYVDGFGHQFAVTLQSANLIANTASRAPDSASIKQKLTDALAAEAYDIDAVAGRVDGETGWAYIGIDLSPEPAKEESIGTALETISGHQVGSTQAVAAAATIDAAIHNVSLKQVGYGAVPLPIVEDGDLAQRWSEGHVSIDTLMDYFTAGSTGFDAVPLPGDISNGQLELIIIDAASLAYRAHKPMMIRLLPINGKFAGDRTTFDDPALANVTLQPVNYPHASH